MQRVVSPSFRSQDSRLSQSLVKPWSRSACMLLAGTCPRFSNNSRANVSAAVSLGELPCPWRLLRICWSVRPASLPMAVWADTQYSAAVLLSYGQGDFLAQFRTDAAFGQATVEHHPGFQSRWSAAAAFLIWSSMWPRVRGARAAIGRDPSSPSTCCMSSSDS
jgi:hypothetical protein